MNKGVDPVFRFASMLASFSTRHATVLRHPFSAAMNKGVASSFTLGISTGALNSNKTDTTRVLPCWAAISNGLDTDFVKIFFLSSTDNTTNNFRTNAKCPARAALREDFKTTVIKKKK